MKFGRDYVKSVIIVQSLFDLKSAGYSIQRHLADCIRTLGYKSFLSDADLRYNSVIRPDD